MRKYYLKTMGCQMNEHDSEKIRGILESMGYLSTENLEEADLILYNTCSVRENPERKVYGHIARFKALKDQKPDLIIGICGCMPQQEGERENILEKLPHVDLIFGTHNIHRLPELLSRVEQNKEQVVEVWDQAKENVEDLPVRRQNNLKAYVNIIYGCTNFCSYCIVPYTRGRERSRFPEAIRAEVQDLANEGFKEVTLLGQNVNAYGKDLPSTYDFADLLADINEVPGLERIRFTTSHPRDMSEKLIQALAQLEKVCEHLHLPVQSGSDRILAKMNRGYTRRHYLELVERIKKAVPGISLTTDIIVGFPGETDQDFQATLELVKEVGYSSAFTFLYSPRQGTPAASMPDQVSEELKKERIYELIEVQNEISANIMKETVGENLEILVEGYNAETEEIVGRTRTNKQVFCPLPANRSVDDVVGTLQVAQITQAQTWTLRGKLF